MNTFQIIFFNELRLLQRNRLLWIILPIALLLGFYIGVIAQVQLYNIWGIWCTMSIFITLSFIVANDQIYRDKEYRVAEIIFTSPVRSWQYICGKYAANFAVSLVISLIFTGMTLFVNQFIIMQDSNPFTSALIKVEPNQIIYSSPGAFAYLYMWLWLYPVTLAFGIALFNFLIILLRGQRVLAMIVIVMIWVLASNGNTLPFVLDPTGAQLGNYLQISKQFYQIPEIKSNISIIYPLIQQYIFQPLPEQFYINRLLLIAGTIILIVLVIIMVNRKRRQLI